MEKLYVELIMCIIITLDFNDDLYLEQTGSDNSSLP